MPKRKKFPRLPSGFGSIRYIGKGRRLPYAVHPPCTDRNEDGFYIRPKALCYVPDWYTGFSVLTAWHAGTYTPGLEATIALETKSTTDSDLDLFCRRVLKNMAIVSQETAQTEHPPTFKDVYDLWFEWKYGANAAKKLSASSEGSTKAAFALLSGLHDKPLNQITLNQLQDTINGIRKSRSTVNNALAVIKQVYRFALPRELCEKDFGSYVVMPAAPEQEHHEPFTDEELKMLWKHKDDKIIRSILIMCYSGFRISAYLDIETSLQEWYFKGGIKSAAGKGRVVPIHSAIQPLVKAAACDYLCGMTDAGFRETMKSKLKYIGLTPRTPHSCRHTFSRLCESYGVNEADRKRMMGHSFGSDITNGIYGHRTLEELRAEIEKIKAPGL